jgi:hypothetical protein
LKVVFIVIAFTFVLLVANITQSVLGVNSVNITSPESNPYGLSYEDHIKNFWKYIISIPADKNPWNDKTGANCGVGQLATNSSVFYLSGNGGGKTDAICKVPAGKGLFIPVSPMEISDKEAPNTSVEDLHRIAKKDQDSVTSLYLKIGDKEYKLQDLSKYRKPTGDFEVVFPKNAVFGASAGNSKAAADGYYVITEPLPKGNYTVTYKSSLICPGTDCLQPNFAQDLNYKLIVE